MPSPRDLNRLRVRLFSVVIVAIGIALIVEAVVADQSAIAGRVVIGVLFVALGAARLYVQERGER